jgi:hypothetical protein
MDIADLADAIEKAPLERARNADKSKLTMQAKKGNCTGADADVVPLRARA